MTNEHEPFRSDLPLYLSGDLSPHEEDAVEEHLARCPACRREVVELGETFQALQNAANCAPPVVLRPRSGPWLVRVAALVLAFVAGMAVRGGAAVDKPVAPIETATAREPAEPAETPAMASRERLIRAARAAEGKQRTNLGRALVVLHALSAEGD